MLLNILIPTLDSRTELFDRLYIELDKQILAANMQKHICILYTLSHQDRPIGERRNILLKRAFTEYCCFFDDDDLPTPFYIQELVTGMEQGVDCCSLTGIYTLNGQNPEVFEHSLQYKAWKTNNYARYPAVKYERPPNHLNCIKSSIAKQFDFPAISHGEDHAWSNKLAWSGLLKTQYTVTQPIYQYLKTTR